VQIKGYIELGGWQAWEYKIRKQDKATDSESAPTKYCGLMCQIFQKGDANGAKSDFGGIEKEILRSVGAQGVENVQNSRN